MSGYAQNAIAAKIKALYGKRLTENDYRQLMQKKSTGEVAAYLKHETCYSSSLGEVKEELIHRGQLENLVRKRSVDLQLRLFKFGFSDNMFSRLYTIEQEIQQLLLILRMLGSENMGQYVTAFPAYLDKYLAFDLFALAKITTYDDLLDGVKGSEYYNILGPFRPISSHQSIDLPGCETALQTYYYKKGQLLISTNYRGDTREDLTKILQARVDLHNAVLIYRMKRYFSMTPDQIRRLIIPVKGTLQSRIINEAVDAADAPGVLDALQQNLVFRKHLRLSPDDVKLEWTFDSMRQAICRRIFRFSTHPIVIMFAYMSLLEIETTNIINIIEGTHYNVPVEELRKLLII